MADLFSVGSDYYNSANNYRGTPASIAPPPTTNPLMPVVTNSQAKNVDRTFNTSQAQRQTYNKTGTTRTSQREDKNLRNVSQAVFDLMNRRAGAIEGDATLNAADEGKRAAIQEAMQALQSFDAEAIQRGAEGNVADLKRQLLEEIMPGITGAVEASGTSNNALAALTANDAAIRTAEAQARVREQARQNAARELSSLITGATQASNVSSSLQDAVSQFLNASKGAVEQGTNITSGISTTNESGETVTGTQASGTEGTSTTSLEYDAEAAAKAEELAAQQADRDRMAKFAMLQASLGPFQNMQDMFADSRLGMSQTNRRAANQKGIRQVAGLLGL